MPPGIFRGAVFHGAFWNSAAAKASRAVEQEIADINGQMQRSSRRFEAVTRQMLEEKRAREREIIELQQRYQALRSLTVGQEAIAEAHRAILQRRSWLERVVELSLGFVVGVLSSLSATVIWYMRRARPITEDEARQLEFD